jgi:hypothetical protein
MGVLNDESLFDHIPACHGPNKPDSGHLGKTARRST